MNKKLPAIMLVSIIICSMILINAASSEVIPQPVKLKLFVGPTSVPADNSPYNCIFVQLQDSSGKPARALQDTTISLSSSLTNIGTVDSSITIPKGTTFAAANFYATFTPGATAIAATATGFATVQASVTTVGPIPSSIAVYGFPSILPADGGSYDAIMVQLQDSSGTPAKAPVEGIEVTLSCSNTEVGTVTSSITIPGGETYAKAAFTTNATKTGSAVITAVASGYTSKQVTITTRYTTTEEVSTSTNKLVIYAGSPKLSADKSAYRQIAVQLQNTTGIPIVASTDITVTIASSNENVGKTDSQIIIPKSKTYALATITTTYKAGSTTITAVATDFTTDQEAITTTGFIPAKLAVYTVPSILPADNGNYQVVQVQLQDSQGRPARDPESEVTVSLFSSKPTVGDVNPTITIPFGKTHATGGLKVTNNPGLTSVTAQASSYTTGQASITTYTIDFTALDVTVVANSENILNGNKTEITAYITAEGNPIEGVTVKFTSNNGGTFTATKQGEEGYYKATFTAPSFAKTTVCTITATASKTGYLSSEATTDVTVGLVANLTSSTLQLRIQDSNGNYLSNATISSTTQPYGMKKLSGITNETGHISFRNMTAGLYTFEITKEGYGTTNQTINFKGKPLSITLTLFGISSENNYLIIIAVVVIVAVASICTVIIIKRRKSRNLIESNDVTKYLRT